MLTLAALIVGFAVVNASGNSASSQAQPIAVWSDEFNGAAGSAPSASNWTYQVGGNGWGNGESECYTNSRANSALDGNGDLVISALSDPGHKCTGGNVNNYTSARLTSNGLYSFQYGRVEIKATIPTGNGIWPAFWAMGIDHDTAGWPTCGEIDIMEVLGSDPNTIHSSVHGPKADGSLYSLTGTVTAKADLSLAPHVYGMSWTPDEVSYDLDGVKYLTITRAQVEATGTWVFDHPFYLLMNVAVGGTWPGYPDGSTTWPQTSTIDYVRVYKS
jgi:beta-glucanase (GH16 family)